MEDSREKGVVLLVTTLGAFLTPFMSNAITIALPAIGREFSMSAILLNWVATSFILAAAVFLVPFGKVADIWGRKRIFLCGMGIYTLSTLLCAASGSAFLLLLFRVLQGAGSAMVFSTSAAILTSVFPVGERGRALGVNASATYLGLSLGPALGGLLTQHFGWRSIFLVNVLLGLAVIVLVVWKLKGEWSEAKGERLDYSGALIYMVAIVAVMYGFSRLPALLGGVLILLGALGIVSFVFRETRAANPILNMSLFRNNRVFSFSNLAALINYSATFALSFLLSLYLQYLKGLSPQAAGLVLVAQPAIMAAASPFTGRLSDRIEPRIVASIGMGLTAIGLALLMFLTQATALWLIVADLVLLGSGFALFSAPNTNALMSSVEKRFYGIASATLGTMRLLGQTLSMGIAMLLFAVSMGNVQITREYYPAFLVSVRTAFVIFAVLCFGGIFASLVRGKVR